ncbi:DnaJ domain-containing protein [Aquihabitans sp. G128]|uniref:J domain-containing protein n=1 Tax=Aquihabitans sp. G128 TaxID=2849779 RepID=UPI0020B39533
MRAAYRVLAGRLHPDRMVDGSPAERALADRRMREVNEAWHVLQDPVRRRAYDDSRIQGRRASTAAGPSSTAGKRPTTVVPVDDDDLVDVLPEMTGVQAGLFRHLPWVVLVVLFGLIFVGTAYATHGGDDAPQRRPVEAGTCIDVATGPTTTIVPCTGPHELQIVARVDSATACPADTERRRLGTDGLFDCVTAGS